MILFELLVFVADQTWVEKDFRSCDALFVFHLDNNVVRELVLPLLEAKRVFIYRYFFLEVGCNVAHLLLNVTDVLQMFRLDGLAALLKLFE